MATLGVPRAPVFGRPISPVLVVPPAGYGQKLSQSRESYDLGRISLRYTYEELSEATKNWSKGRQLGSGSYGAVFKGEMKDGSEVAVKMIDLGALAKTDQSEDMAGFDKEVETLSKFRHPNLVTLIGWGKHERKRYLVYELMTGGDIYDRLLKSRRRENAVPFHWHERLSALLDAAAGLSHMHNSKPKAFHRDIKSANILLDRHGTAKMADFGLSCTSSGQGLGGSQVKVKTISGTPGYACPIYASTGQVTEFSEVYSFGMVILEVLTSIPPAAADHLRLVPDANQTLRAMRAFLLMLLAPAAALPEFPASWGKPPQMMTMDYVPLAGGYGHGSGSLSRWIYQNIQADRAAGKVQYPPAFGEAPKMQTRDLRPLPFGYGQGSGTMASWLKKQAKEIYNENPDEFDGMEKMLNKQVGHARRFEVIE
ncbi:unnamed protein product [Effrenium voratum]|nr:unnamed protein product [Effrenium voratum]